MSRFFHWYTSLTQSDVNWTTAAIVMLAASVLLMYVDAWLTRAREDRRDDEVRM